MASFHSLTGRWDTNNIEPEEEEMINFVLQRDTDVLSSFYGVEEIINSKRELLKHLLRPGIVEKVLDFLSNDELMRDNDSVDVLQILVREIIYAPSQSTCFNVDPSTIDSCVEKLSIVSSDVGRVIIQLLAKITKNPNAQIYAGRAGAIDVLVPMLPLETLLSARGAMLEVLTNIAQHPLNAIWFRTCNELAGKLSALMHDSSQSVRYRVAKLVVSITIHTKVIEPEVAFIIIDLLLTAMRNSSQDKLVYEQLISAISNLREVPEYCSLIDGNVSLDG